MANISGHFAIQLIVDDETFLDLEVPADISTSFVKASGNGWDEPREEAHAEIDAVNALVDSNKGNVEWVNGKQRRVMRWDMSEMLTDKQIAVLAERILPLISELNSRGRRIAA